MSSPTVDQLRDAVAEVGQLISGIGADQWTAATPCEGWDVRELVSHVVAGNQLFAAALRGEDPAPVSATEDLTAAFAESDRELVSAFASPGVLQQLVQVPFGTVPGEVALHLRLTEMLVHGWDIARATSQQPAFDEAVAIQELQFSRGALGAIPAERRPFGPSQPAADDASALEQLVALLGRTP